MNLSPIDQAGTEPVLLLPDPHGFALARRTLRDPFASREAQIAACDVLAASHNWNDSWLVEEMHRSLMRSAAADLARRLDEANSKAESVKERALLDDVNYFLGWIAIGFAVYFGWAMWSLARVKGWL